MTSEPIGETWEQRFGAEAPKQLQVLWRGTAAEMFAEHLAAATAERPRRCCLGSSAPLRTIRKPCSWRARSSTGSGTAVTGATLSLDCDDGARSSRQGRDVPRERAPSDSQGYGAEGDGEGFTDDYP